MSFAETYSHSLLLFPQDVTTGFILKLTLDGVNYQAKLTIPENGTTLVSGTHYFYNITVNKTALQVSRAAIAPWNNGGSQNGDAVMK